MVIFKNQASPPCNPPTPTSKYTASNGDNITLFFIERKVDIEFFVPQYYSISSY